MLSVGSALVRNIVEVVIKARAKRQTTTVHDLATHLLVTTHAAHHTSFAFSFAASGLINKRNQEV